MAKFVLAGRADCPYYAKAELLADYLQTNLPNFRIHKITQHPDNWEKWLQEVCENNGWTHKRSPIIWRELLDRGGKGLLLGGFNEFLEHAQHYYNITSDMVTAEMCQIAEENLQTHIEVEQEEEELKSLISPLRIWINRAAGHICYHLIPLLANGEIFGMETEVSLHLLDRSDCEGVLRGVVMEAEDMAFPLLRSVSLHTDLEGAFLQADVIILLDDILQENIPTLEDCIHQVTGQCQVYGPLIDRNAKRDVKIVLMGRTFSNLKALMLMMNAPSINPRNIVTLAMLECEAKAMLARKLKMHSAGIKNLIIWGNVSGSSFIDLSHTELYRYDSAIWGPPSFSRPVLDVLFDREWMFSEFVALLGSLSSWGHHCLGMGPAHVIATVLRYWCQGSPPKESVSLGVISEGQFGLPEGIVFSMPVKFQNGRWEVLTETGISKKNQEYLQILARDLIREKEVALGEATELYPRRRVPHWAEEKVEVESLSKEELEISSTGPIILEEPGPEVPEGLPDELKESKSPEEENNEEPTDAAPCPSATRRCLSPTFWAGRRLEEKTAKWTFRLSADSNEPANEKETEQSSQFSGPSSVPLLSSEGLALSHPFPSVPSLGLPSSRPSGDEVLRAQKMENHNKLQGREDTSRQVLVSLKAELTKTQESVEALFSESRYLRKQLNKWKGKAQLLGSAQEDGNSRLQASIHDLIASQECLTVELQEVRQEIKNITKCNEEFLKARSFSNGPDSSLLKPSRPGYSEDRSSDPTSHFPERKWLLDPQTDLLSRNSESPETEPFQSAKPEVDRRQIHGVRSVPLMPESSHLNQSQITSPRSPTAQAPPPSEKGTEEEEEEELQQLMLKLKEALSLRVHPGQCSALKEELLSAAERLSKSFSSLVGQDSWVSGLKTSSSRTHSRLTAILQL